MLVSWKGGGGGGISSTCNGYSASNILLLHLRSVERRGFCTSPSYNIIKGDEMEESILFSVERDDTDGGDHDLLQLII
jgi:hypothetical protein